MVGTFDFRAVEKQVNKFWKDNSIYKKAKDKGKKGEKFYFLDGPPYTSGKVHIGTAWNKTLKDFVLRYKRMRGFHVWDRAGYDMHGLPTEHGVEKELGIQGRKEIEKYGKENFIEECRKFCTKNMLDMNKIFQSLGVWMDFENAYQTISKEYMEGEWWLIKKAHEKGRLYEGERSMTWDAYSATALAKHELVYENVTDTSIYVKLKVNGKKNTYLTIWTTTPWTIPFNLAVMAGPKIKYCKIKLNFDGQEENWYVAKDLLEDFVKNKLGLSYSVEKEILGSDLEGIEYEHPFAGSVSKYEELKKLMPKVHTVVLSNEFVDTAAGTGLVHCAPGCGPEDYEVGHRNGIKPFNELDEQGVFLGPEPFKGLTAKKDDEKIIQIIEDSGSLVYVENYTHEYPFGERSKKPVIFRVTKQWFLKIEDIKNNLITENNKISWVPRAAFNAFHNWLENLRDNSISRQRYWGTPLPIWRNVDDPDDYIVVGSAKELAELADIKEPDDLHIPTVDKIIIKKNGLEYRRVPDVLDVWIDSGSASWNCLNFPAREDLLKEWFPATFILEGKDQVRAWFNLLHISSMVALETPSFKSVYMHGFVNDAHGRKMSKSLGNYILPDEVVDKYGVDATRYYMIGAANPGIDMNYNFEDLEVKFKNLLVFWNMHRYLLELSKEVSPQPIGELKLGPEERYILSRLHTTIKELTSAFDEYRLNEIPGFVESLLLDISRTYIQLVRDKSVGSDEEKKIVVSVLLETLLQSITLLAPIAPFFTEQVYKNMKEVFHLKEQSVHLLEWPKHDEKLTDKQLESDMEIAKDVIAAILEARDRAQIGVRWPAKEVKIECTKEQQKSIKQMRSLIEYQTNLKNVSFESVELDFDFKPNARYIGREFGDKTGDVITLIRNNKAKIKKMLVEKKQKIKLEGTEISEEHLEIKRKAPEPYQLGQGNTLRVYLDTTKTDALLKEGFAREVTRRLQQMRKNAGLVKKDRITVEINAEGDVKAAIEKHKKDVAERIGATEISLVNEIKLKHTSNEKVKGEEFKLGFSIN